MAMPADTGDALMYELGGLAASGDLRQEHARAHDDNAQRPHQRQRGLLRAKQAELIDQSRRDDLPQQHEKDRIANAEGRRDPSDREHVKGNQDTSKKEVRRCAERAAQRSVGEQHHDTGAGQSDDKQDHSGSGWRAELLAQSCVEPGQNRDTDSGGKHNESRI